MISGSIKVSTEEEFNLVEFFREGLNWVFKKAVCSRLIDVPLEPI